MKGSIELARVYDGDRAKAPPTRSEIWDIVIKQEQIILTLLQTITAVQARDAADFTRFQSEVMERIADLDQTRDALLYRDVP